MPTLSVTANRAAWYRFNRGITADGAGLVSQWDDASGNDRHLLQATLANRPTQQSDGSILFDGVDKFMNVTVTLAQPVTLYILFKQVTFTDLDYIFSGDSGGFHFRQNAPSPGVSIYAGVADIRTNDLILDTYGIATIVFNGASSILTINNNIATTGNAGASGATLFSLGVDNGGTSYSNIQVKEILIYSVAHDQATRFRVINYLMQLGDVALPTTTKSVVIERPTIIASQRVGVAKVRWAGSTSGNAYLADGDDNVFWRATHTANTAIETDFSRFPRTAMNWNLQGLTSATMDSGKLYISLE